MTLVLSVLFFQMLNEFLLDLRRNFLRTIVVIAVLFALPIYFMDSYGASLEKEGKIHSTFHN